MAWTDERLDDLSRGMEAGFARVDRDIRELRGEIGTLRGELRGDIGELRGELRGDIEELRGELRGDIEELRTHMNRLGGGLMVGLVVVIATVFANGG